MSEIRVNTLGNESNTGGPVLSGITTFSGQQYFIPPTGTTAERPSGCPPGSIRFNTDSAHLEYWNGLVWLEFEASSEELGNQLVTNSAGGTGTRGLIAGGITPSILDSINYISISTLGDGYNFGDLNGATRLAAGCASRTRGLFAGGASPAPTKTNKIDLVTIASTANAVDFGTLTYDTYKPQVAQFNKLGKESITLNTNYLSEDYNEVIKQLMMSEQVWLTRLDNPAPDSNNLETVLAVIPKTQSVTYKTSLNDRLVQYTVDFDYAFDKINTVR